MAGSDTLTALECHDIRFPTSDRLDGPDAMNPDPDHSAAHVALRTTGGPRGHGLRFTIGRGNEVMTARSGRPRRTSPAARRASAKRWRLPWSGSGWTRSASSSCTTSRTLCGRFRQLAATCAEFDVPLKAAALRIPFGHPAVAPAVVGAAAAGEMAGNAALFARRIPDALWHTLVARGLLDPDLPLPLHDRARPGAHP